MLSRRTRAETREDGRWPCSGDDRSFQTRVSHVAVVAFGAKLETNIFLGSDCVASGGASAFAGTFTPLTKGGKAAGQIDRLWIPFRFDDVMMF
jgi:hypothetical protein